MATKTLPAYKHPPAKGGGGSSSSSSSSSGGGGGGSSSAPSAAPSAAPSSAASSGSTNPLSSLSASGLEDQLSSVMDQARQQAAEALKPLTEGSPFAAIPGLQDAVEDLGEGMKELKEALDKIPGVDTDELMKQLEEAAGPAGDIVGDLAKGELPGGMDILEAADADTAAKVKEAMASIFGDKSDGKSGGKSDRAGGGKSGRPSGGGGKSGRPSGGGGGGRGGGKPRGAPGR